MNRNKFFRQATQREESILSALETSWLIKLSDPRNKPCQGDAYEFKRRSAQSVYHQP